MSDHVPALLIDATEWFLDPAWQQHISPRHWRRLPHRGGRVLEALGALLASAGAKATVLVEPWLAAESPEQLRDLARQGLELALAVRLPRPLTDVVDAGERRQLAATWGQQREQLERAAEAPVLGFASVRSQARGADRWWAAALREHGFAYDASATDSGDGRAAVAILLGGSCPVERFCGWRLDREQPRLMGLPPDVRAAHEAQYEGAADELLDLARRASATVVSTLDAGVVAEARAAGASARPAEVADASPRRAFLPPASDAAGARPLTIVVPLKDEADGVASLFEDLDLLVDEFADLASLRFVVVDDGSGDSTWPQLEALARSRPRVRLVRHPQNRGVAAAIRTGIETADTDLVASIDGDLSYDPRELRAMLQLFDATGADVVTSSPYHPRGNVQNVPGWRLFLSRTLSTAYRILLRSDLHTWTSCFRLYRRDRVGGLPLVHDGFLGTAELIVRVLRRGGRVAEHPCTLEARLLGFSKMRVLDTVFEHLGLLVQVLFRRVR